MGRILAVCRSDKKGISKQVIEEGTFLIGYGMETDAHADSSSHRQVSLMAMESIDKMKELGLDVGPGAFAENLTTEGIDVCSLPVGTRLNVGDEVLLEITQIGKECHTKCAIFKQVGQCIMPKEGVFTRVLRGGKVKPGEEIKVQD